MKSGVRISIVIPVYNVEPYLAECLDSILCQTFCDYEIICIDDASTDNSFQILKEYADKEKRIHILKNEKNQGQSYSRNRGIEMAVGKYIVFVDSDDMLKPEALNQLWETVEERDFPEILYYDAEIRNEGIWAKEQVEQRRFDFVFDSPFKDGKNFYVQLSECSELIVEPYRQMICKDFLVDNSITFYNGIYHEDVLFSFRCAMKAVKVFYLQKELYIYRRRDNSTMSVMNFRRVQSYFIVMIELWNLWKNGVWEDSVNKVFERYLADFYREVVRVSSYYPDGELLDFGSAADKFLYPIVTGKKLNEFEYADFSAEQILQIKKTSKIMVYGAGTIGEEVIRFLRNHAIRVSCILVSNKGSNAESLLGVPIIQFDTVEIESDTLIIVSVIKSNKKAINSILSTLHEHSLNNIMLYDGEMM